MSLTVLAIDTSSATGSVALVRGGETLGEAALTSLPGHSESLLYALTRLLADAGVTLDGVDLLAAGVGPGSFTGLRVGLSAMKGLHLATGTPLLGAPSLLALAMHADRSDRAPLVCAAIDARRGDVFAAVYRAEGGAYAPVVPEQMTRPGALHALLEGLGAPVLCLGDAFFPAAPPLVAALPCMIVPPVPALHLPSAVHVAAIAAARRARGEADLAAGLEPRYVRPVDFKTS